jgi:hypothetical protein
MKFIPIIIQAVEFKEYYSIKPGKPKTGGSDRMQPPGRKKALGIKRSPPWKFEKQDLPGERPFCHPFTTLMSCFSTTGQV